jgi:ketosteroid isomerase-like protein
MSEKNVEIVRAAIEATLRRPKPDWETMNALFHPDHEFLSRVDLGLEPVAGQKGGGHRGARGYRDWPTSATEFIEWESTLAEVTDIDQERVLAVTENRFRGKQSGARTEQRLATVLTVREGKVVRTEVYGSPEEALEAAGPSE